MLLAGILLSWGGCSPDASQRDPSGATRGTPVGEPSKSPTGNALIPKPAGHTSLAKFVERTPDCGVEFRYVNGEEHGHHAILESLGGGGAFLDFDKDGRLDVFLTGGGGFAPDKRILGAENGLFRCLSDWQYSPVQRMAGVSSAPFYSHGAAVADFNQDGFPDVLITGYGGLALFCNSGDGTFAEVALSAGLIDPAWSSSAAWGDVDGDGNLDLYVAHYVDWSFENHPDCRTGDDREVCPPRRFQPLADAFFSSNGDGTFRDHSAQVGLEPGGKGLGVVIADVDVDGWVDIYVCNDTVPNFLYQNDRSGTFSNRALFSGTAHGDTGIPEGSMGVDIGDFNRDGLPDIWVANYENESFGLYRNQGDCFFQHVSRSLGVTAMGGLFVGWGTSFIDFDRDGDRDLIATNGHVIRHPINAPLLQRPLLLENLNGERFVNIAEDAGTYMNRSHMGRGLAVGDLDRDGDEDILIVHTNEPVALLANESPNTHRWIGVRLIGTVSNRDAIGARIRVLTDDGRLQHRQIKGGGSYASTSAPECLFGLGHAHAVREIEIHWPSGTTTLIESPAVNELLTLVEP